MAGPSKIVNLFERKKLGIVAFVYFSFKLRDIVLLISYIFSHIKTSQPRNSTTESIVNLHRISEGFANENGLSGRTQFYEISVKTDFGWIVYILYIYAAYVCVI